jgi:hypothetical protein
MGKLEVGSIRHRAKRIAHGVKSEIAKKKIAKK